MALLFGAKGGGGVGVGVDGGVGRGVISPTTAAPKAGLFGLLSSPSGESTGLPDSCERKLSAMCGLYHIVFLLIFCCNWSWTGFLRRRRFRGVVGYAAAIFSGVIFGFVFSGAGISTPGFAATKSRLRRGSAAMVCETSLIFS